MLRIAYIAVPLMVFMSTGLLHRGHRIALMFFIPVLLGEMCREKSIRYFCYYCALYGIVIQFLYMLQIKSILDSRNAIAATHYIIIGMAFYVSVIKSGISKEKIYNIICISAMLQVILGLLQAQGIDPYFYSLQLFFTASHKLDPNVVIGTLGNPNFIAAYIAISLPFFFRKPWVWFTPFIIWQLWTLNTSGAVYAALSGSAVYFTPIKLNKKTVFLNNFSRRYGPSILAIIIGVIYTIHGEKTEGVVSGFFLGKDELGKIAFVEPRSRWEYWLNTLERVFRHWYTILIGYGPGAKTAFRFPIHNEWLEYWYQFGLPAIGAGCAFIIGMRKQNKILFAALIVAAVNCLANYPLHLAPSAMLILIIMGLLEREKWQIF